MAYTENEQMVPDLVRGHKVKHGMSLLKLVQ